MTKEERYNLYDRAIKVWGNDAQYNQLIEEMAELTIASSKLKRQEHGEYQNIDIESNFKEELCDVFMCLELFFKKYGQQDLDKIFNEKLLKFKKQIEIAENKQDNN